MAPSLYMSIVMLMLAASSTIQIHAFVTKSSSSSSSSSPSNVIRQVDMSLNVLPPMIIGPMIKKMREEKAKKNAPMVSEDDTKGQAPGLRVGGNTWKWPPIWPYDQTFFTPTEDIPKQENAQANPMSGMLSGMPENPIPAEPEAPEIELLDPVKYWQVEKADVKTDTDEEAVEKLKR